ncbi:MAG: hypothetical protein ACFFEF_01135 [Candidatus Thorarchaeota archaeon]
MRKGITFVLSMILILLTASFFISSYFGPPVSSDAYDPGPIVFRSYLGGNFKEEVIEVEVDDYGNVILVGYSDSEEFPLVSPNNHRFGLTDVFVAKVSPTGMLLYFLLFGGSSHDIATDAFVEHDGRIHIIGYSASSNLPATDDAFQHTLSGKSNDTFLMEISPFGELVYCSYFGGSKEDYGYGIIADSSGGLVFVGVTSSSDFPLLNAEREDMAGETDLYLARLDSNRSHLSYSTLWGSDETDAFNQQGDPIVVGNNDRLFVAASTTSLSYPATRGPRNQSLDAFIACFNSSGFLMNNHFVNSSSMDDEDDFISTIAIGPDGMIYSLGTIHEKVGRALNGSGAYAYLNEKVMVSKMDQDFSKNELTCYLDGYFATATDMRISAEGSILITGQTESKRFPCINPIEEYSGGFDSFLTIIESTSFSITSSSCLGGLNNELSTHIAIDQRGTVVLAGSTNSIDLIPVNPFQSRKADSGYRYDAYVLSLNLNNIGSETISPNQITFSGDMIGIAIAISPPILVVVALYYIDMLRKKSRETKS